MKNLLLHLHITWKTKYCTRVATWKNYLSIYV